MTEPRKAMLQHAAELITGERNATYGSPTQNFTDTAAFWTIQLKHKLKTDAQIDASDVAKLMISLKLCRMIASSKDDNWVDIAGYAGCGYETEGYGKTPYSTNLCGEAVINLGDPEPDRDWELEDTEGDLMWYDRDKGGWTYGMDVEPWGDFSDYFPMVRVK